MADSLILKSLARVTDTSPDDAPFGGFEAIASTPEVDRDGDTISQKDWSPLPDRITIDVDHSMDVRGTIGSAHPYFDDSGNLCISAKFASTPLAQEVRSLVTEGHIDSVSVAFMRNSTKSASGDKITSLELLNVGVVAIPSNRGAKVLAAKSLRVIDEFDPEPEIKLGARNNAKDQTHLQAAHDHLVMLGAQCSVEDDTEDEDGDESGKAFFDPDSVEVKSVSNTPWSNFSAADYTIEQYRRACLIGPSSPSNNKSDYKLPVREPSGALNRNGVHAAASVLAGGRGGVNASPADKASAARKLVSLYRNQLKEDPPASLLRAAGESSDDGKSVGDEVTAKAASHPEDSPGSLASATDAALDQAIDLFAKVDSSSLPDEVQQAIALIQAADNSVDKLLRAMDVPDPDEDTTDDSDSDATGKSVASDSVDSAAVNARALQLAFECEALSLSDDNE